MDEPSLSQRAADAVAQWNWEAAVRRPDGTGGGGPVGGGIGNVAGWAVFFGMLGAIVGFIMIHTVGGAIAGAVVAGGGMAAVAKFFSGSASGSRSGKSVLLWTLGGVIGGAMFGLFMGSPDETRMANAATNWAIFGGLGFGLWRRLRR